MTTRVPASMFGGFLTPESFGAKGDGTTDDTAAINATATAAGDWGQVFLNPAKTYRVTAAITPRSGQRWFGGGKLTTANGFNFNVFQLTGKTDVTIEGLRGESGNLGAAYTPATARFVAATAGSHRCRVLRCHTTGFQSAIQFNASANCLAEDNEIVAPIGWGINVQTDADDACVRNNRITGVASVAISAITAANPAVVTTSSAHGFATGDYVVVRLVGGMTQMLNKTSRITVTSATTFRMDDIDSSAYTAYTSGGWVRNRLIEHGIYVAGGTGNNVRAPIIEDNRVTLAAIDGVKVAYADDAQVTGNVCLSNGGEGVYVTIAATRTVVEDNTLEGNANGVIVFTGTTSDVVDRTRVVNNTSRKNLKNGISVTCSGTGAVSNTTITGNDVDDNDQEATTTQYGIVLAGGANNTGAWVYGNRVANEAIGIRVAASVPSARLGQNTFAGNTTNISDSGTTTAIEQLTSGVTTSVADGGTITHGHPKTPTSVRCTSSVSGEFISVTAISATTFTVAIKKHDNSAGTTQTVYWDAAG
jgi:nitrous oxidase accessory protein NosD